MRERYFTIWIIQITLCLKISYSQPENQTKVTDSKMSFSHLLKHHIYIFDPNTSFGTHHVALSILFINTTLRFLDLVHSFTKIQQNYY
jgi:hypothetical protein